MLLVSAVLKKCALVMCKLSMFPLVHIDTVHALPLLHALPSRRPDAGVL